VPAFEVYNLFHFLAWPLVAESKVSTTIDTNWATELRRNKRITMARDQKPMLKRKMNGKNESFGRRTKYVPLPGVSI